MICRLPVWFAVLIAASAFGQGNRLGSPSGFGNINYPGTGHPPANGSSGFGNINYPGTGRPPQFRLPGAITDPSFAARLGSTVRGYPPYGGVARGTAHPSHGRQVIVPVPIIVGGGYYSYDGSAGYQDQGGAPVQQQYQQAAPPPVVIINQAYRPAPEYPDDMPSATIRRYDTPVHPLPDPNDVQEQPARRTRSADDDKATIYLIAFKDHTILPALAYWMEGDTLNYITQQGTPNRASLSLIDREFSKQLNRERQVEFSLP
jgi:hypothetical protein